MKLSLAATLFFFPVTFSSDTAETDADKTSRVSFTSRAARSVPLHQNYDYEPAEDVEPVDPYYYYSFKFTGCISTLTWDPIRGTQHEQYASFRICPSSLCSSCEHHTNHPHVNDYEVDLKSFVKTYLEYQYILESKVLQNEVEDEPPPVVFDPPDYLTCAPYGVAGGGAEYDLYLGLYCDTEEEQVNIRVFEDDACTTLSPDSVHDVTGFDGPSLSIGKEDECLPCLGIDEVGYNQLVC